MIALFELVRLFLAGVSGVLLALVFLAMANEWARRRVAAAPRPPVDPPATPQPARTTP